jgi:glycosyltransferase involved in cell wall biosynthesis/protein-tyrosine-phosphatase
VIATESRSATPGASVATTELPTICHIFSGDLWAGAEVVIFNLLSSLGERGDVRVLALSLNEGVLTERLRAAGVITHVIPESRHAMPAMLRRAATMLRDARVTIIHSHGYKQDFLACLLAKWLRVSEVVSTLHGLPEPATHGAWERWVVRWRTGFHYFMIRTFFSAVVAVSADMKQALAGQHGFRPDHVHVIRNGGRFPSAPSASTSNDTRFHIGSVGRMVPVKDFELFLEAAAALRRHGPVVRFSILGDGPLRQELARRAEELNLSDCVEFLPPRPDPFPYYRSLDVYLNTSLHEGLPLSVVEAMACGKPIVSAAVGGIPEIVVHGQHGFLVDERDPSRFADCCRRLMLDGELRTAMGERARAAAHAGLSATAMTDGYRRLYEECGARARGRYEQGGEAFGRVVGWAKRHARRLVERIERRRAETLRRKPGKMAKRLRSARSILVLCEGNVIRSVFAAQLLSTALKGRSGLAIRSAGLATQPGWRAHARVVAQCRQCGIDVGGHTSVAATAAMVKAADVVLVMEVSQLVRVTRRFFGARRKTFLLTCLAPGVPMEITDPAGKDDPIVDACLEHVALAVQPLIEVLADRGGAAA